MQEIQQDFQALRAVVSRVVGHSFDVLTTPERLALLEQLAHETRRLRVPGHALINQIAEAIQRHRAGRQTVPCVGRPATHHPAARPTDG